MTIFLLEGVTQCVLLLGLILMSFGRHLAFKSKVEVSLAQFSLTMIERGLLECLLNFPSLKKSNTVFTFVGLNLSKS